MPLATDHISIELGVCVADAVVASCGIIWLFIRNLKSLSRHFFFLFFLLTTVIYLQVGPLLSLLQESVPQSLAVWGLSHPREYLHEYAILQTACLLLFQLPIAFLYFRMQPRQLTDVLAVVTTKRRAQITAVGCIILLIWYACIVLKYNIFYARLGTEGSAQFIVSLPFIDFIVYRSYQESALLINGVLFILWKIVPKSVTVLSVAFWLNLTFYGSLCLINSRVSVIFLLITMLSWWLALHKRSNSLPKQILRLFLAAGVLLYLSIVVVNVRTLRMDGVSIFRYFDPTSASGLITKSEGYSRIDGIDLMARIRPGIFEKGLAWGEAWKGSYWLVGRFIDPEGFAASRLTMIENAKGYLMLRYWGWATTDYLSCSLTDMYGNFGAASFIVICGFYLWAFLFYLGCFWNPTSGKVFLMGLFLVTNILVFEGSTDALLFGWVRKLPVLMLFLIARPFVLRASPNISSLRISPADFRK